MSPAALAALHSRCFTAPRPFTEAEFAVLLDGPGSVLCAETDGFALGRAVADEAELLTLAVDPAARRRGIGARLLARFEREAAAQGAATGFLEVAADNAAALALYKAGGWTAAGRRPGYYDAPGGGRVDAVIMQKALPPV